MKDRLNINRFKFRIYCKSENKMMLFNNPTLIDGDIMQGGLLFKNYDHKIKNVHEVAPEDLILMQCTGLKDKNGVLIYEGDICKIPAFSNYLFRIYFNEKDASFYAWCQDGGSCLTFSDEFEVVGNIYETPELLEDNNVNN